MIRSHSSAAVLAILALTAFLATRAAAAELVMIERPGCVWCERWRAEIGPAFPNTDEGRRAPLRRVDLTSPWPTDLAAIAPDIVTPTFVLVDRGVEVARMRGYVGDQFFWPMFAEMLAKLPGAVRE